MELNRVTAEQRRVHGCQSVGDGLADCRETGDRSLLCRGIDEGSRPIDKVRFEPPAAAATSCFLVA